MKISFQDFLSSLPLISKSVEECSVGHNKRIACLAEILICKLRQMHPELLDEDEAKRIVMFAPLHDIGKLTVPDYILKKSGPLTSEEYEVIKTHAVQGAEILKNRIKFKSDADMATAINLTMLHHEKFDGSGYPYGLKGNQIPLCARITAIVDIYDALRSERSYKKALTKEQAEKIILEGDSRIKPCQFDPVLIEVFKTCLDDFDKIYQ